MAEARYNLPTIPIDIFKICIVQDDWVTRRQGLIVGRTFVYEAATVKNEAAELEMNIDEFFTSHILSGMFKKKMKRPVLFFYCVSNDFFFVSACCNTLQTNFQMMYQIPGNVESGDEPIKPRSSPYIYWDGASGYRIHREPEARGRASFIVEDFCALVGDSINTAYASNEVYQRISTMKKSNQEYSAIPMESFQEILFHNKKYELKHAFYEIVGRQK
ncbi:MAG: hypothetical protein WBZ48_13395 [Bacteroidota bacterium]